MDVILQKRVEDCKKIWSLGEGPQIDEALFNYATTPVSTETIVANLNWQDILHQFHKYSIDDQFIPPLVRINEEKQPVGIVKDGDVVFYFDFRTDRAKPLTSCFLQIPYGGQVGGLSNTPSPNVRMVTMSHYDDNFNQSNRLYEAFYPAKPLQDTYSEYAGQQGIDQIVVAESEKWRAITWFKDGRRNLGYNLKENVDIIRTDTHPTLPITIKVVKSRQVAAHIQQPIMRAQEITDILIDSVDKNITDIFVNYANSDMVGHSMTDLKWYDGVVTAIETLDTQLGRIVPHALNKGYVVFLTADHGNAENMVYQNGKPNPAHTNNLVPFIIMGLKGQNLSLKKGATIGNLAPTVCHLRGLPFPKSWDRDSIIEGQFEPNKKMKILKIVLDGYGINPDNESKYNAMATATQKKGSPLNVDIWFNDKNNLSIAAEASGINCGYPKGEAGTTEFGHVLFDSGRMVRSDLLLIDHCIETGEFFQNQAFLENIKYIKENPSQNLHIMGIVSDGHVHSSLPHLEALLKLINLQQVKSQQISVHVITDGRDVPGDSSPAFIDWLEKELKKYNAGQINSVWGRGWGKDRDNRWKRIESAFKSLVMGTGAIHVLPSHT